MAFDLKNKMSLIRTDVTAVKLYEKYVLAGIGSSLYVHDKNTGKRISIHDQILNVQKIYGIVPSKNKTKLLIFGGKQFNIINGLNLEERVFEFSPGSIACDDWLHSCVWVSDSEVALLTAHNVVQMWNVSSEPVITSRRIFKDNSILYSGLLLPLLDDLLVFSGTVFSEVIISRCKNERTLHRLTGHKGVIFSISCCLQRGIIVTTSDDRSVRIWSLNGSTESSDTANFWDIITISCTNVSYGHSSRVMRCCITGDLIVSVGEDSCVCFWGCNGELLKKIQAHRNGPIWSVDSNNGHLVTGGGDCAVILHPLKLASDCSDSVTIKIKVGTPKKLAFTARRNIVFLDETGNLIYYNVDEESQTVHKVTHESTYAMLSISACKQVVAIADMSGILNVFVENCKGTAFINNIISTKLNVNKILSMDWAGNRRIVLCSGNGEIYVLASRVNDVEIVHKFTLPCCKERWLTAAAVGFEDSLLAVGDRCGNVHIYMKGNTNPIKTFNKVHGRYGPTSIIIKSNEIITTGRDGTAKYFSIVYKNYNYHVRLVGSKDIGFTWVERHIDPRGELVCGFQERIFVVSDTRRNSRIVEVACGGGHRSWDVVRYVDKVNGRHEKIIKFIYLKNSDVNVETFQLSNILSRHIISGTHAKEINCLKSHRIRADEPLLYFLTGGEDTTLRISCSSRRSDFREEVVLKQLSSIRTLKTYMLDIDKMLVVTGGGRAQICIKKVDFNRHNGEVKVVVEDLVDFLIKGTDRERKGDKTWRDRTVDFDPETRIMNLELVETANGSFNVYAGCSDALLRVFNFKYEKDNALFRPIGQLEHHNTCILKTHSFKHLNSVTLLTCSTTGEMCFWDVTEHADKFDASAKPFLVVTTHKSGINCVATETLSDARVLIATGGDDNTVHVKLLAMNGGDLKTAALIHSWASDGYHSSQITGLLMNDNTLITASIDQRITVFRVAEQGNDVVFVNQLVTDIADVHGIELTECDDNQIVNCGDVIKEFRHR